MWLEDEDEEEADVRIESEIDSEVEGMLYAQIHYELPNPVNTTDNPATEEQLKLSEINQPGHSSPFIDGKSIGIQDINEVVRAKTPVSVNQDVLNVEKQTKRPKKAKAKDRQKRKQCPEVNGLIIGIKKRKQCSDSSVIVISDSDVSPQKQSYSEERRTSFVSVSIENTKVENRKKSKLGNKKKGKTPTDIVELFSNSEDDMANAPTSVSLRQDIVLNLQNGRSQPRNVDYNSDTDDFELEKIKANMSDGNWQILDVDRYSAVRNKSRYFKNNNDGGMRCRHCQQYGHSSFACPQPKKAIMCIYCGRANHTSYQCPDAMCGRCWSAGHSSSSCWMTNKMLKISCTLCRFQGHSEYQCPDYWRRYHLTTTVGPPVASKNPYKFNERIFCYNCGREGHFGFVCSQPRMYVTMYPSCPFVVRYEEPDLHAGQNGLFIPQNMRADAKIQFAKCRLFYKKFHNKKRNWKQQKWRKQKREQNTNGISNNKNASSASNNAKSQTRKEKLGEKVPKSKKKKTKKKVPENSACAEEEELPPFKKMKKPKKKLKHQKDLEDEVPNLKNRKAKKRCKLFLKCKERLCDTHVF